VTCIAFKVYIWSVHVFSGSQTHDLGAMLYCFRNEQIHLEPKTTTKH